MAAMYHVYRHDAYNGHLIANCGPELQITRAATHMYVIEQAIVIPQTQEHIIGLLLLFFSSHFSSELYHKPVRGLNYLRIYNLEGKTTD